MKEKTFVLFCAKFCGGLTGFLSSYNVWSSDINDMKYIWMAGSTFFGFAYPLYITFIGFNIAATQQMIKNNKYN